MIVLGLHGGVTIGQHEPSATLLINGQVVAICEEERYLRIKSCYGYLPLYSIKACLDIANIPFSAIDLVVTPGVTYGDFGERIKLYLEHCFGSCPRVECVHHQHAHLAAAFYGSGFTESLVLSMDATGDGSSCMAGYATQDQGLNILDTVPTENSLGFFYTLMTYYLGFTDGDEYKVMGLAPYGEPNIDLSSVIQPTMTGWQLNSSYIRQEPKLRSPFEPTYTTKLEQLLGKKHRLPGEQLSKFHKDVAASTQAMFEQCLQAKVKYIQSKVQHQAKNSLCFAGGAALNCSANKQLLYADNLQQVYVSPVASDRGLALGCAYLGALDLGDKPWQLPPAYLGSSYSNASTYAELKANGLKFSEVTEPGSKAANLIASGKIVGWFQGRSEAGARALGNRSILADCRDSSMRDIVNKKIKYRESFRPFAPSCLYEDSEHYFYTKGKHLSSMSFTVDVVSDFAESIPAVSHVDTTARLQTVSSSDNPLYYDLIKNFKAITGCPVIMNTSFNLKGQPIVETPRDAIMTFFGCGLDALIIGNFLLEK